jgi:hypothetical protein
MGGIDLENSWWYYRRVVGQSWAKCKSGGFNGTHICQIRMPQLSFNAVDQSLLRCGSLKFQ